jgi:diguanylate cyclase (GGDEF)-like protein
VDVAVRLGDVLYRSDRTRIERVDDPEAGPCVRKEFAGPDARARLRREVAALRRLEGVAGVPGLLAVLADDGALLLEDLGEEVLQRGGLREPDEVRRLAAGLAETLADVHERQVLHLDINPSNAVLTSRGVALIDFDVSAVASGPAREVPRDVIGGTLAYMAPEQTGRTGRPVDERSDLYALGGTMYELATGHPPLTGTDSLRLIRDQLAGTHVPVQTLNPRVPDRLRAIIDRLLNKDPELRYQSASGLAHDLRAPLTESSPLGQGDFPARLAPPPRVIGRRAEQDLVRAAFDGMLTGRLRGIMVAGPGGIGKTSLIGTLRPVVAGAGGRFVTGKYDQYRQDQSSDAVVHALRGLARLLATSPNDELVAIRARLAEAGVDGASVTALVPEFGALVGDSGGIEPRSDEEARSRFVHSATAVLQAVVSHRRPLVVVLDDLQWSSAVGIDLLDAVFLGGRIDGLLIAGAYRDAEIGPTHPLFALLEKWRTAGVTPEAITLHDLPVPETETLPAEMMRMPEEPARAVAVPVEEACRRLGPALREGMVVRDAETGEVHFRHDRVQHVRLDRRRVGGGGRGPPGDRRAGRADRGRADTADAAGRVLRRARHDALAGDGGPAALDRERAAPGADRVARARRHRRHPHPGELRRLVRDHPFSHRGRRRAGLGGRGRTGPVPGGGVHGPLVRADRGRRATRPDRPGGAAAGRRHAVRLRHLSRDRADAAGLRRLAGRLRRRGGGRGRVRRADRQRAGGRDHLHVPVVRLLMRGQTLEPGYDDAAYRRSAATNPMAMTYFHTVHGPAAAIFGDENELNQHAAAAVKGLPSIAASYSTSTVHFLGALAGSDRAKRWLAARAEDAPANFRHLVAFVDGNYELALEQLGTRRRPWQRALITERYARSLLRTGQAVAGRRLLADARDLYDQWGATAKVRALWTEYPYLKNSAPNRATISMSAQTIDMMATLRASQALSSETTIAGLSARTDEVLGSLTGANRVTILLRHGDGWNTANGRDDGFPRSVVRYVERVGEHLLVGDAVTDDRFADDPHFAGLGRCSLLAVPISAGEMNRAMLLLENTLSSEAFTDERLDIVKLVAGQLAVSLGNIRLYAELENRVAERTEALSEANRRLEEMSRTDPLTGLPNRREHDRALDYAWRQGRPVAVAMIDVDHFKLYNDHYGHPAGDEVLRRLASALRDGLGATDLVARYGGEEFTLVLPGATEATARTAGERALRACFDLGLEHVGNPPGRITVSVGVACLNPSASAGPAALLQAADEQLYRAKLSGRNRVAQHPG